MLALSPETEALVRAEAVKLGKTEDEVIRALLAKGATHHPLPNALIADLSPEEREKQIDVIVRRHLVRPILDTRSADEILGYDEHGLFG